MQRVEPKAKHQEAAMARFLISCAALAALAVAAPASAQSVNDVVRQITRPNASVSERDASDGLRAALDLSARGVTERLGRPNGFFGDPKIQIPLPGTLARIQKGLKPLGLSGALDDVQLQINRSAEAAMPTARRLFLDAIRGLTIQDALTILRGGDDAATRLLRARTETSLTALLTPPMEQALTQTGAYRALENAARRTPMAGANLAGVTRTDLTNFAVQKTLDGAFAYIAEEERNIRKDPAKRTTDLLRRVFGGR
jgi:hypothetical protein